jgi:hypothetical protein
LARYGERLAQQAPGPEEHKDRYKHEDREQVKLTHEVESEALQKAHDECGE